MVYIPDGESVEQASWAAMRIPFSDLDVESSSNKFHRFLARKHRSGPELNVRFTIGVEHCGGEEMEA